MGETINQEPALLPRPEVQVANEATETERRDIGKTVLFRVMRTEGLNIHQNEEGHDIYTVQNSHYEEGDYAFDNFDSAATRAPGLRGAAPVYALHAQAEDVSYRHETNPDSNPDVVTIRNGAQVRIQEVPQEVVEAHAYRRADDPGYTTERVLDILKQ